jgi:hypothetical protein
VCALLNVWANEEIISISCARSLPLTEGFLHVYATLIPIERFFFPPERSNRSPQRTIGVGRDARSTLMRDSKGNALCSGEPHKLLLVLALTLLRGRTCLSHEA